MALSFVFLAWVVCGAYLAFLLTKLYRLAFPYGYENLKAIPGPPKVPFFGTFFHVPTTTLGFTKMSIETSETYGSPMWTQFSPGGHAVCISKAEHVETVLQSSVNLKKTSAYDPILPWLGEGLLLSSGVRWQQHRKLLTPTFHFAILEDFVSVFNEQALILVDVLKQNVKGLESGEQAPLNVCKFLRNCTLDIVCETAMGKKINAQTSTSPYVTAIAECVHKCSRADPLQEMGFRFVSTLHVMSFFNMCFSRFSRLAIERMLKFWQQSSIIYRLTADGKRATRALKVMHDFRETVIREREAELISDNNPVSKKTKKRTTFLNLLLELKRSGQFSDVDVREEVDTFMFEGHDTTASAMMWATYILGKHPDVQARARAEIQRLLGTGEHARMPTIADLNSMHYLDRCLKESHRLYPAVPTIGRKLSESVRFGKYTVEAGLEVDIFIMALHRDPEQFPDPLRYDPDRFLPENCAKRNPFAFVPFSAGQRNCIGQRFAMLEEKAVMSCLLRYFDIESTQDAADVEPCIELTLKPLNGIFVKLRERRS